MATCPVSVRSDGTSTGGNKVSAMFTTLDTNLDDPTERIRAAYPMGPVMEGVGLNITVLSNRGSVDFGFMVDKELVPDVWNMADRVPDALAELQAAAGAS